MIIDWSATGAMLSGLGTLIGAFAVIYATWVARDTFSIWKKQKIAERRMVLAEKILHSAYDAKRALDVIRSPFSYGDLKLTKEQQRSATATDYLNRFQNTSTQQQALFDNIPMAKALYGEALEKALSSLRHQFHLIHVDVQEYTSQHYESYDLELKTKIRNSMYGGAAHGQDDRDDEMSRNIAGYIKTIESICLTDLRLDMIS